jgi:hypothetical protein
VCSMSQSETSITSTRGLGSPSASPKLVANISFASTRMCWGLFWNLVTMPARHCSILIDRCNGTPWRTQNRSQTKADDDFRVSEMCEDLIDRPFVRSRTPASLLVGTPSIKRSSFFAVAA